MERQCSSLNSEQSAQSLVSENSFPTTYCLLEGFTSSWWNLRVAILKHLVSSKLHITCFQALGLFDSSYNLVNENNNSSKMIISKFCWVFITCQKLSQELPHLCSTVYTAQWVKDYHLHCTGEKTEVWKGWGLWLKLFSSQIPGIKPRSTNLCTYALKNYYHPTLWISKVSGGLGSCSVSHR